VFFVVKIRGYGNTKERRMQFFKKFVLCVGVSQVFVILVMIWKIKGQKKLFNGDLTVKLYTRSLIKREDV